MGESNASEQRPEHRLSLDNVLADLVADGLIGRGAAQGLERTLSQRDRAERHPLELVADAKLHHAESPRRILIKATVIGVVAQRLVRTLCPHCREPERPDPDLWGSLVSPWPIPLPEVLFAPKGCLECRNTGYHGRIGLYEILVLDQAIRDLIRPDFDEPPLRHLAYEKGLRPLRIGGALKVAQGLTSLEEVFKVAPIRAD